MYIGYLRAVAAAISFSIAICSKMQVDAAAT